VNLILEPLLFLSHLAAFCMAICQDIGG
jgi:hypothetical protein